MRHIFKETKKEEFFDNYKSGNIKTPDDKIHFNSEPDSAKHADKNSVNYKLGAGVFVVSKNVINVMAEKSGYGHVESVEKIRNGRALERKIKVLRKIKTEAHSKTSCHIAKSGKIEEDHHCKDKHIEPCAENGNFFGI